MTRSLTLHACCLTLLLACHSLPAFAQENTDNSNVMVAPLTQPDEPSMQMQESAPSLTRGIPRPKNLNDMKQGTWSYEVMKIARASGCEGDGAWLIGKDGMEETYQVFCPTERQFVAVCVRSGCIEVD
ncbi:hypothetical protein ACUHMQ_00100 [Chitinimonas sp. PSY-7]|uniref:hypothetical protein n=1 Tax=Chitinimonas sp. PSY-7 TaxID=3459088 RepID=UPI00404013ED